MELTFTHKGWVLIAPVYLGGHDGFTPVVKARHWTLEWLLDACEVVMRMFYRGGFPILVTGELAEPIRVKT
ncbi:hypothetical protein [Petrachloros mirabilis]